MIDSPIPDEQELQGWWGWYFDRRSPVEAARMQTKRNAVQTRESVSEDAMSLANGDRARPSA